MGSKGGQWDEAAVLPGQRLCDIHAAGVLAFLVVIVRSLPSHRCISFHRVEWRANATWVGIDNYVKPAERTRSSSRRSRTPDPDRRMVILPTVLGLALASLLYSYVSRRFGGKWASFFRAGFYLPQVMPVAVAGVVWG